jgi:hypothetical protein
MGRPVKLTDRNKEWFLRSSCRERVVDTREERQRILIVCEGDKTEPNYFIGFKPELPPKVIELEIHGGEGNTISLVDRAKEIKADRAVGDFPFDQVWVVFDRYSFDASDFDNAISKANAHGMRCGWSNEAFEFWYILHFEYRDTGMRRTEYQEKLTQLLGQRYQKNFPDIYIQLARHGNQEQAIARARRLHEDAIAARTAPSLANPCTTVFELVEELNRFKSVKDTES